MKIVPGIDRDLDTICLKCLEKAPARRFSGAGELAGDLDRYLKGIPIHARPASMLEKLAKRVRRNKAVSAALLVLAVVLAVGAVGGTIGLMEWSRQRRELTKGKEDARKAKREAEKQAEEALKILQKGRAVSAVLRSAEIELGDLLRDLYGRRSSGDGVNGRGEFGKTVESKFRDFSKMLPGDSASLATWTACRGWLRAAEGNREKAEQLFEESRRADPDVAYGDFFEAMLLLALLQEAAEWNCRGPGEDGRAGKHVERFETSLAAAETSDVWGEVAAEDFREAVQGFHALVNGDFTEAENRLTTALSIPELTWVRPEIRISRAACFCRRAELDKALSDLEAAQKKQPGRRKIRLLRGRIHYLKAVEIAKTTSKSSPGEDVTANLEMEREKTMEQLRKALELEAVSVRELREDPAFASIADTPGFREMLLEAGGK
jgi:tetratricopeptide (TPR) repeat protein